MKTENAREKLFATTILAGLALGLTPAVAQTPAASGAEEAEDDTIVVTGSRIARSTFTSESPVSVISGETIAQSGDVNLGEVLRTDPSIQGTGGFNASSNLSGGGASSVDIRGLGSDRTLNLINGRRVANFADALQNEAADLGFVPQAMIERVEILKDGGSAVYGADAVAGVVNVILKDDYEGVELNFQTGVTGEGDRKSNQIQAVFGTSSERGNIVLSAEYAFQDGVPQKDRDWAFPTIAGLGATSVTNGSGFHPGGSINFIGAGAPTAAIDWCTKPIALGGDELTNVAGTTNCPAQAPSSATALIGRYDYALVQSILNQNENFNLAGFANYNLFGSVNMFAEFQYANRESESVLDGNPIAGGQGSPAFPGGWVVPANNPYNPTANAGTGFVGYAAQVSQRPTSTIGPRNQYIDATSLRFVTGLQGEVAGFDWELSYLRNEVDSSVTTDATWNLARANRISDPALCAIDPNCVAALKPGSLGALDVYRPANWGESEIAYMRQVATSTSNFTLEGVSGYIGGDIMELPAGPLGIAIGFDYRDEGVLNRPDAITEAGESVANQTFTTQGGFDSTELFGEANIPLLSDVPFAKELSVNVQGRWFDYSNFGTDTVYKIGLNYVPIEDVRLRGTMSTSFRAPTLVDIFSGGTVSFDFITDPCDASVLEATGLDAPSATRVANCASTGALGVPTGFTQAAPQLPVLGGGDLADGTFDLQPETSEAFTVGAVFTPSFLPGFRASVDYWSLRVENLITSTDIQNDVLDVCYESTGLSDPTCGAFSRDPFSKQLSGLAESSVNAEGNSDAAGIDWAVEYSFDLFAGRMTLTNEGTYLADYNWTSAGPGSYNQTNGNSLTPQARTNFGVKYSLGDWQATLQGRYIPKIDDISSRGNGRNPLKYDYIEEYKILDARVRWDVTDTSRLLFGVNNLLNEEPPYVFNTGNNTSPGLYGSAVIGRYFFVRATQKF